MTSKPQNTETAVSDTATATVGSPQEDTHHSSDLNPAASPNTLQATAGRTPPLRPRPSSSAPKDSKTSKKKKPASKSAKRGSVPAMTQNPISSLSKISGSRSVGAKRHKPRASLPEASTTEPWTVEQAQAAHTISPGATSESLVTISRDTGSTDEPLSPFFKKRGLLSTSSKRPNAPEEPTDMASKSKQDTAPPSLKQTWSSSTVPRDKQDARQSGLSSDEVIRSAMKSLKKTSKTLAGASSEVSRRKSSVPAFSRTPKLGSRKGSDVDASRLLDVLVDSMRDITSDLSKGGGAGSSVEDSDASRLPFSSCTRSAAPPTPAAPPVPPAAKRPLGPPFGPPAARPAALDRGCDLIGFTTAVGTGSLFLVMLLYLFKGFRSHVLACGEHHNCSTANATYPPHT